MSAQFPSTRPYYWAAVGGFFTQIQVSDLFTAAVSGGLTLQRLVGPVCPGRAKSVNINKRIGLEILINYAYLARHRTLIADTMLSCLYLSNVGTGDMVTIM